VSATTVGLFLRENANLFVWLERKNAERIEQSLRRFQYLQVLFRDNPYSLGYTLHASTLAIELAKSQGHTERIGHLIDTGDKVAAKLEKAERTPNLEYALWLYYRAVGRPQLASRAISRVGIHPGTYSFFLAADLLENHDRETALRLFDEATASVMRSKYIRLARAHLVPSQPDGDSQILELVDEYAADPSPLIRRWALLAMCRTCSREEIRDEAEKGLRMSDSDEDYPAIASWGDRACVEFLAGRIDEEQLFEQTGIEGLSGAAGYFTVAMAKFAEKKPDDAEKYFRLCIKTTNICTFDLNWARAYLKHLPTLHQTSN
jgi:hypothetical protein